MRVNPNKGIFLGKVMGQLYYLDTKENIVVYAPKRTGGQLGITIPNLLLTPRDVVVEDRGDIYEATSKYRKEVLGQVIVKIKIGDEIPDLPRENFTIYVRSDKTHTDKEITEVFKKISEKLEAKEFLAFGKQKALECFTEPSVQKVAFIQNPPLIKSNLYIDWNEDPEHCLLFNGGKEKKIRKCFFFREKPFSERKGL